MNNEDVYVIAGDDLKKVMGCLSQLPYKDVHVPLYILENLAILKFKEGYDMPAPEEFEG